MHQNVHTTMSKSAISLAIIFFAFFSMAAFAHDDKSHKKSNAPVSTIQHAWGQAGDAKKITRTINISMSDNMCFTPSTIIVKQGETIRFVVTNGGKLLHEMVIGTTAELTKHAELMKKHPQMEHDEPYMAHVAAGKRANLIWHFSMPGTFEFACLIPGHFEAGMRGTIIVNA